MTTGTLAKDEEHHKSPTSRMLSYVNSRVEKVVAVQDLESQVHGSVDFQIELPRYHDVPVLRGDHLLQAAIRINMK